MNGSEPPPTGVSPGVRDHHCHRVLSLTGSLDISNRDAVDRELRDHIDAVASSVIIVDLSAVTYMDAAGLDPLLHAHSELAELERVLAVQSISAPVNRLFRLLAGIRPHGLIRQTLRTGSAPPGARPEADGSDQDLPGRHARHVQADLRAHAVLNEATGLLMAVHDCNADQARLLLELVARRRGVPVDELAAGIVTAADAAATHPPGAGLAAMVPAGVRAVLSTRVPSPGTAPGSAS
jgi:anti-anti-sigma factor